MRVTPGPLGTLARIQLGLRFTSVVGWTLTGILLTLSWPRWCVSGRLREGALSFFSGMRLSGLGGCWRDCNGFSPAQDMLCAGDARHACMDTSTVLVGLAAILGTREFPTGLCR